MTATGEIDKDYQVLGLKPGASREEIDEAYKDLVNVWHPDRFMDNPRLQEKANEKLKEINIAYKELKEYLANFHHNINSGAETEQSSEELWKAFFARREPTHEAGGRSGAKVEQPNSANYGEEQEPSNLLEKQCSEALNWYAAFYRDIAEPLNKFESKRVIARAIGLQIPRISRYDFENFNVLLHNNLNFEIREKAVIFMQEQSTFYVLFSDRFLFSSLGNQGRSSVMDDLEKGYLSQMVDLANHDQAFWHYYKKFILKREREFAQCKSMDAFLGSYQANLITQLGLENSYSSVKLCLFPIINVGSMMFAMNMLSRLTPPSSR